MNAVMVGTSVLLAMCLILAGLANLQGLTTSIMFRERIGDRTMVVAIARRSFISSRRQDSLSAPWHRPDSSWCQG